MMCFEVMGQFITSKKNQELFFINLGTKNCLEKLDNEITLSIFHRRSIYQISAIQANSFTITVLERFVPTQPFL